MGHYKEIAKVVRKGYPFTDTAMIYEDFQNKAFSAFSKHDRNPDYATTSFEVKRNYGAGLSFGMIKHGKRITQLSMELGKNEVELMIQFLQSVLPELQNYNGVYVNEPLIDLTK